MSSQLMSLDSSGLNMLHYTCMFNYHRLVEILLAHHAGPQALHPFPVASFLGHSRLVFERVTVVEMEFAWLARLQLFRER